MNTTGRPSNRQSGIVLAAVGLLVWPGLACMVALCYSVLVVQGVLIRWRPLGTPSEDTSRIVAADYFTIFVESVDGKPYVFEATALSSGWHGTVEAGQWRVASIEEANVARSNLINQRDCGARRQFGPPPPDTVADNLSLSCGIGDVQVDVSYALLENGTVWRLTPGVVEEAFIPAFAVALLALAAVGVPLIWLARKALVVPSARP